MENRVIPKQIFLNEDKRILMGTIIPFISQNAEEIVDLGRAYVILLSFDGIVPIDFPDIESDFLQDIDLIGQNLRGDFVDEG